MTITAEIAADLLRQALEVKGTEHVQQACNYIVADVPTFFGDGTAEIGYEDAVLRDDVDELTPKPGCLVGTALWLYDKDALLEAIIPNPGAYNGELITNDEVLGSLSQAGIDIDPEALNIFNTAQEAQDGRGRFEQQGNQTWGVAVFEATN